MSQSYYAANYAGLSAGLEKYLFKFRWGTVAFSLLYEAVYSSGELLQHQFDHGPAAFIKMYFSRIAIPAVALGVTYNADKNYFQFAFNIGVAF